MKTLNRCGWEISDPLYIQYHDTEWGVPVYDDKKLFEFLILEGFQAGLSWITILRKRESFRKAFANFDPEGVAKFGEMEINGLMLNNGIIRNRQKIEAAITNARAFLHIQEQFGSFSTYMWQFVDGKPIINTWHDLAEIPAQTELSEKLSRDLKQRGFRFVGPTIVYAHMQAVGMVNDHLVHCFRYSQLNTP
jgi:DNA-3-methyladenine glycosylase I